MPELESAKGVKICISVPACSVVAGCQCRAISGDSGAKGGGADHGDSELTLAVKISVSAPWEVSAVVMAGVSGNRRRSEIHCRQKGSLSLGGRARAGRKGKGKDNNVGRDGDG